MALYQERGGFYETYMLASPERQVVLLNNEIANIESKIRYTKQEIRKLGISWSDEKRQKKRQMKEELKALNDRLSGLQILRGWNNRAL